MQNSVSVNNAIIEQWIAEKLDLLLIQERLSALGWDEETVAAYTKEFKKARNAKRQFTGFILLAAGAFLGFLSCVLTLINPVPELYNWILFGLTTIAILVIFTGLYFIFE